MNPLKTILVYDDLCPLCTWYSGLFVKFGFISPSGRVAFSNAPPSVLSLIDIDKGRNEIPLVDVESKKVFYGIEALLVILGKKLPMINVIGKWKPLNWFLRRLYKLVSFNRKVIVATKCGKGKFDCSPEFNIPYRIAFLLVFLVFNSTMLMPIHHNILSILSYYHLSFVQLECAHLLFVLCNCVVAVFLTLPKALEYLGQVNMLALITVLLCVPLGILNKIFLLNEVLITAFLLALLAFIIKDYFRRMQYAGILGNNKIIPKVNFICLFLFLSYLFI